MPEPLVEIRAKMHRFRAAMPSVMLHCAIRANPHPDILCLMLEERVHFEIASLADAQLCVRIETQNIGSDWPLTGKFGAALPEVDEILPAPDSVLLRQIHA